MKYQVKKHRAIYYPDGELRGIRGYVVDGDQPSERATIEQFAEDLEPVRERSAEASPVDVTRLVGAEPKKPAAKKKAKKKTAKKKGLMSKLRKSEGEDS